MKIPYNDSRLQIFLYFPVHILCHHGWEGVLEMMMVDDSGGGSKKGHFVMT